MVAYIIQLAKDIVSATANTRNVRPIFDLIRVLPEELDRLDPRDFLPSAQYDFIMARLAARKCGTTTSISTPGGQLSQIKTMAERVILTLEHYGGEGSQAISRSFDFIKDADLRQIIERDYRELRLKVFPSRAWKSTVILTGSIVEAILFDQLAADPSVVAKAKASPKAPKHKTGAVRDLIAGDWKLFELIDVSVDVGLIPQDRAKTFDQVLRDYRNFVHPKKELRAQHPCTEAEALMSVGALEGVCNLLASSS